jgi:RNA polymerase sigma factor (sigma-70 family)
MASSSVCDLDRTTACEQFQPLVARTVKSLQVDPRLREDANQEGMIGLLNAFDHFDPDKGVHFSVFARSYIKGAIGRGIFGTTPTAEVPVGDSVDLSLLDEDGGGGKSLGDPETALMESLALRDWLDSLAPKDSWLIWRRYWQGVTTAEIAVELKATVHWVNERHRILLSRGRQTLMAA